MVQDRGLLDHVADDPIRLTRASVLDELTVAVDTERAIAQVMSTDAKRAGNGPAKTYG